MIGMALAHPAAEQQARDEAAPLLAQLEALLGPEEAADALERGRARDFDAVMDDLLR